MSNEGRISMLKFRRDRLVVTMESRIEKASIDEMEIKELDKEIDRLRNKPLMERYQTRMSGNDGYKGAKKPRKFNVPEELLWRRDSEHHPASVMSQFNVLGLFYMNPDGLDIRQLVSAALPDFSRDDHPEYYRRLQDAASSTRNALTNRGLLRKFPLDVPYGKVTDYWRITAKGRKAYEKGDLNG